MSVKKINLHKKCIRHGAQSRGGDRGRVREKAREKMQRDAGQSAGHWGGKCDACAIRKSRWAGWHGGQVGKRVPLDGFTWLGTVRYRSMKHLGVSLMAAPSGAMRANSISQSVRQTCAGNSWLSRQLQLQSPNGTPQGSMAGLCRYWPLDCCVMHVNFIYWLNYCYY